MSKINTIIKWASLFEKACDKSLLEPFLSKCYEIKAVNRESVREIRNRIKFTREEKREIDLFFRDNYGRSIPYAWHEKYASYNGTFDCQYFPELLYIPGFEKYENYNLNYCQVFSDKNISSLLAKSIGIQTATDIITCSSGLVRDSEYTIMQKNELIDFLYNIGEVFIKPTVDTGSGKGCMVVNIIHGTDIISNKSVREIVSMLPEDFAIQEKIICHKSIREIYDGSVNTFRIITYRWTQEKNDIIEHMPIIMRVGKNGHFLDNAHQGGLFIGVDDNGNLSDVAYTVSGSKFHQHPDTGYVFSGKNIPFVDDVIDCAKKMHCAIPQIGVINWDFTINNNGEPLLIEINTISGSVWLPEIAHGKSAFGDNTGDVLKWVRKMEKAKPSDRNKYKYGK